MHGALANQVAVVTGASSGIGKAVALALSAQGATLCLLGRHLNTLQLTGSRTAKFAVDLSEEPQIEEVASQLQSALGGVDILVHSAAMFFQDRSDASAEADYDLQYRVNVQAPRLLTERLLPGLRARRGQVVFINSSAVRRGPSGITRYTATKAALKTFADNLRNEVNSAGVRVLSVFPGRTATPMQATIHRLEGKEYQPDRLLQPEDVAAMVVSALCLPRTAEVTEIDLRPMQESVSDFQS